MRSMRKALLLISGLLVASTILPGGVILVVDGQCHHQCSNHGECNTKGQCECWGGYEGWNCSSLACPSAAAWADLAAGTDDAHNSAVCSSMGYCDG